MAGRLGLGMVTASANAKENVMQIAIIGRGNVGRALEEGLRRVGHEVRTCGKAPEEVREAAAWGEVVILAVPYPQLDAAAAEIGDAADGKPLVDVSNALSPGRQFAGSAERSAAEQLQDALPGARVVKAFNTMFAAEMTTGHAKGEQLSLFVAANDAGAKQRIMELGRELGHDAIDAGPLANARWLEALGFLNIQLAMGPSKLGRDIGFRLVH
jgi:predicted dinucleotide-binding enzyme